MRFWLSSGHARKQTLRKHIEKCAIEVAILLNSAKVHCPQLALQLHPDKNGAPGADEAFKSELPPPCPLSSLTYALAIVVVSKAFQILSDSDKRAAYDESGGDPDSRASASPSFTRAGPGGGGFDGEISPEELFNMFFGGGMGSGAGFGQTGFTTFGGTPGDY